jgi:histidyl-tRNA synthetase
MELKLDQQARGTRILFGDTAKNRRTLINKLVSVAEDSGFQELCLPIVEKAEIYATKAGVEILNQMYVFKDKGDRDLCLRPEGTATCQLLAKEVFKTQKDIKLFYVTNCFRYERPQAGRYREFTQFGVEILNPTKDYSAELQTLAIAMISEITDKFEVNSAAKRGLAYYVGDGFEIACPELGAQKQVCGGGSYAEGIGFAFGVDRLLLLNQS